MKRKVFTIKGERYRMIKYEDARVGDYLFYSGENDKPLEWTKPERIKGFAPDFKILTEEGHTYNLASRGLDQFDVGFAARKIT